ncbi:MAG TPA: ABC transporter permease [Pyrinomonadaceae bacterium]|nr:ABC transporter permease [Pyrinomonadaceae bacterium]
MITNLSHDLGFGARSILKNRGLALTAVITLALAIGATTAIFSVVNSVLLRPLPFQNPAELMTVSSRRTDRNDAPFTLPDFLDYRDQNRSLDQIAAFTNVGLSLSGSETTERLQAMRVSSNIFQLLGIDAFQGRTLLPEDDEPGKQHVVVLTHDCWRKRFAGNQQIVGTNIILDTKSYQVVGILPPRFELPIREAELAIPLAPEADPLRTVRSSVNFLRAIARLKSGVTPQQAEADLNGIVHQQRQQFGELYVKKIGVRLVPLQDNMVDGVRTGLWVLLGAVGLVLLIGCSNLAGLWLARASARQREMAIRKALGATSSRLITQLLIESLMLTSIGGFLGILLAGWGIRFLLTISPTPLPREQEIHLDLIVLAFGVLTSVVSALIFGILPALQAAKSEVTGELSVSSRGVGERARGNRWRSTVVMGQVALSALLLIGAGLLIQSFRRVQAIQTGFDTSDVLSIRLSLPETEYKNRAALNLFCDQLGSRIEAMPGVEAVGAISLLPLTGLRHSVDFTVVGRAMSPGETHTTQWRVATPDYFRAMNIPLRQGRNIDEHDNTDSIAVVLINETMARKLWPNGDAIGNQIAIDDNNTGPRAVHIVGVVGDVKQLDLEGDPTFDVYLPLAQVHEDGLSHVTNSLYWVVRSKIDSQVVQNAFRRELREIDPDAATSNIKTLEAYVADAVGPRRFILRLLTTFSIAALVLAATGIYGVISYSVAQRTQEIGIRLALGAGPARVFRSILGQGLKMVTVGLIFGITVALAATRVMRSLLFGIAPSDPFTFLTVSVLLILVTLIASGIPARRAAEVDPLVALRNE